LTRARSLDILSLVGVLAAHSPVCCSLGITDVDPSRKSLLIERFISRECNKPPDINVDFEHE
jgi:error-prone DNA polymerase